jgi:hypothetical protein
MSYERGVLLIIKRGCLAKRGGCLLPNFVDVTPEYGTTSLLRCRIR